MDDAKVHALVSELAEDVRSLADFMVENEPGYRRIFSEKGKSAANQWLDEKLAERAKKQTHPFEK